jgi:hypothetical protein
VGSETVVGSDRSDDITVHDSATGLGGGGDDTLTADNDAIAEGGDGNDRLYLSDDAIGSGGDGNDRIFAWGSGATHGGAGEDVISTLSGATVWGDDGNDIVRVGGGSAGHGDAGDDELRARFGQFNGGAATAYLNMATLSGGSGDDRFVISDSFPEAEPLVSTTMITDFNAADDTLVYETQNTTGLTYGDLSFTSAYDAANQSTLITVTGPANGGNPGAPQVVITKINLVGVQSFDISSIAVTYQALED